jgi:UDP-N-acetylmuramoyl-tripeptide--D-alanyl-D-alanine ligase
MAIDELYTIYLKYPSVQTDSRKCKPGDLFFALKGENFNGNAFVKQALDKGAAFAVIDEEEFAVADKTILVNDVLQTLQLLAKHHREQFKNASPSKGIPFIAITGSNGKTTSKELVHAVLSTQYKTYTTEGNYNNHIGIPLTILKIKKDAAIAVIEMGANHQLEIQGYCTYTLPTHGIITNCGKAHLEGFGGVEGVKKGKGELYDFLKLNNGVAFVMWDYDYLRRMSNGIPVIIKYGTSGADVEGEIIKSEPYLQVKIKKGAEIESIKTQLVGDYNFPNVLLAVTIGKYFKIDDEKIKTAIENYQPSNSRSQLLKKGTNTIFMDAYNANPSSMRPAIENFGKLHEADKILMLGAMAELGEESLAEHRDIIELIKQYQWKNVILVGGDFMKIEHPYLKFENAEKAREWFHKQHFENTHFLIKGSRSMKMEKIIEA